MYERHAVAERRLQRLEACFRGCGIRLVAFFHQRANPIGAPPVIHSHPDSLDHPLDLRHAQDARLDRLAPGRLLVQAGCVEVSVSRHQQGARNRRCRHRKRVDVPALVGQRQPLLDAEPVLFVDDGKAQVGKGDRLLEQGVGSDGDGQRAGSQRRQGHATRAGTAAARQQADLHARGGQKGGQRFEMLLGQDFRGRHDRRLSAGVVCACCGQCGHDRLAAADIALEQAHHALAGGKVAADLRQRPALRARQREGQMRFYSPECGSAEWVGPGGAAALMVAHQRHRKLARQQFVVGEAAARRMAGQHAGRVFGAVDAAKRLAKGRPGLAG